jgi:hypothetical protein
MRYAAKGHWRNPPLSSEGAALCHSLINGLLLSRLLVALCRRSCALFPRCLDALLDLHCYCSHYCKCLASSWSQGWHGGDGFVPALSQLEVMNALQPDSDCAHILKGRVLKQSAGIR